MESTGTKLKRPYYDTLDALRGVASIIVILYHIGEAYASSVYTQWLNHSYLAVHFFFILSGFVIGSAYDSRKDKISNWEFIKRRIIRLHPMVFIASFLGVIAYVVQGSTMWNGVKIPLWQVGTCFLATIFMIPASPNSLLDIRGFGELYPLVGPMWSLLFEYIGSILYAIWFRYLPTKILAGIVILSGFMVGGYAIGNLSNFGHLGVGWSMSNGYFWAGLLCLIFCFSMG